MKDQTLLNTVTKDGLRGAVNFDTERPGLALLEMETGRKVWIPRELLVERPDGRYYLPVDFETIETHGGNLPGPDMPFLVIPVVQEELTIENQLRTTGRVQIKKRVHSHEELVDEPGYVEEVHVERVPVNQVVEAPVSPRQEGNTLIIPLIEEVLVVEKRLMLREELHVTKLRKEVRNPVKVTLRREEAEIERFDEPTEDSG